jgi:SPP1 family predicted phage head-tail adaptor
MRAGSLRHLVTIEAQTKTQDSTGSIVTAWETFATVHASIEPISGREFFAASQVQSSVNTRIRNRYLSGITPKMRVVHDTTVYDIEAVLQDDRSGRHEMQLMCIKRGAQGYRSGQ